MEESRKVYGWLVRDRNAAVESSSMWAGARGGENYCGNLLWQSGLTLLSPNTEVKGSIAEGSAGPARARVGRRQLFFALRCAPGLRVGRASLFLMPDIFFVAQFIVPSCRRRT